MTRSGTVTRAGRASEQRVVARELAELGARVGGLINTGSRLLPVAGTLLRRGCVAGRVIASRRRDVAFAAARYSRWRRLRVTATSLVRRTSATAGSDSIGRSRSWVS